MSPGPNVHSRQQRYRRLVYIIICAVICSTYAAALATWTYVTAKRTSDAADAAALAAGRSNRNLRFQCEALVRLAQAHDDEPGLAGISAIDCADKVKQLIREAR